MWAHGAANSLAMNHLDKRKGHTIESHMVAIFARHDTISARSLHRRCIGGGRTESQVMICFVTFVTSSRCDSDHILFLSFLASFLVFILVFVLVVRNGIGCIEPKHVLVGAIYDKRRWVRKSGLGRVGKKWQETVRNNGDYSRLRKNDD